MPNKNTKIEIRISEEEKQELQEILKPKKLNISAFLRNYIQNFPTFSCYKIQNQKNKHHR